MIAAPIRCSPDVEQRQPAEAVLRVPAQDSWDASQVREIDEETRFNSWTGLAAHPPLGNVNRARDQTYRHLADFRVRVNGCPYHGPSGVDA